MADEQKNDSQEKTEEPTQRQLEKFREEGQVAKSQEITSMFGFIAAIAGFYFAGKNILESVVTCTQTALISADFDTMSDAVSRLSSSAQDAFISLMPVLGLMFVTAILAGSTQTKFLVTLKALKPKADKISPLGGIKRLFSSQSAVNFIKNALKAGVIGWILYRVISNRFDEIINISQIAVYDQFIYIFKLIASIFLITVIFLFVVSVFDYLYQYHSVRKKMKMSKQDIKEEMKQTHVPEGVRAKLKQVQHERARREIETQVPNADVVITNPTHFAVALQYVRGQHSAPKVLAKGADLLAQRIRELAKDNEIVIYEEPPLARALYKRVKVGKEIPIDLFKAVAKVLAYVYKLKKIKPAIKAVNT